MVELMTALILTIALGSVLHGKGLIGYVLGVLVIGTSSYLSYSEVSAEANNCVSCDPNIYAIAAGFALNVGFLMFVAFSIYMCILSLTALSLGKRTKKNGQIVLWTGISGIILLMALQILLFHPSALSSLVYSVLISLRYLWLDWAEEWWTPVGLIAILAASGIWYRRALRKWTE